MPDAVIDIQGVGFSYNGRPIFDNVEFRVQRGDFVALIGPNGGGKTTLLRLMLGLLKPDAGRIRLLGKNPGEVSDRIGYVPQDVHINPAFPIRVVDVVKMGGWKPYRRGRGPGAKAHHDVALATLAKLSLDGLAHWPLGELSGGQRQRVFIARALVSGPEILFLDEPTTHMDSHGQTALYNLLSELNKSMTILLVSHDVMMVSSYVKTIACINRSIHHHNEAEFTQEMMATYHCPVELIAHGQPHRVLKDH